MLRSPTARAVLGILAVIAALAVLRYKPWQRAETAAATLGSPNKTRQELTVGFLPVT